MKGRADTLPVRALICTLAATLLTAALKGSYVLRHMPADWRVPFIISASIALPLAVLVLSTLTPNNRSVLWGSFVCGTSPYIACVATYLLVVFFTEPKYPPLLDVWAGIELIGVSLLFPYFAFYGFYVSCFSIALYLASYRFTHNR